MECNYSLPGPSSSWEAEVNWKHMARPILLAVDDDANLLEAVVKDLRREYGAAYRVIHAGGGQAALETLAQLKTRQEPVALLLRGQRMTG